MSIEEEEMNKIMDTLIMEDEYGKMQRKKFYEERQHKTIIQNNLFTSYALLHLFSAAAPLYCLPFYIFLVLSNHHHF